MFINNNSSIRAAVDSNDSFVVSELLWLTEVPSNEYLYQQIVFKVLRKPKKLMFHIQRIYFTYGLGMQDQLFAALVDLLVILDGNGTALSKRMIAATRSILRDEQSKMLDGYLANLNYCVFMGNQYSVCTAGVLSNQEIILAEVKLVDEKHDPLVLARDYIEYSQLEQALKTLEDAMLETPKRLDIQGELINLLKQTKDKQAYIRIQNKLLEQQWDESMEWKKLASYFYEK